MVLPGDKCAFVETADLMHLVDSILVCLGAIEDFPIEFATSDILQRQTGEIKAIFCNE